MTALCVDAGTSRLKCVAFDDDGAELAVADTAVPVERPAPGASEQDPDTVADAVATVVRECVGRLDGAAAAVDVLALTAQGDGFWPVDRHGRATGPAVLWNDARAGAVVDRWDADGLLAEAFAVSGCDGNAGLPHAILAWLREHDPARLEDVDRALTCNGWLFSVLTGHRELDRSDAGNPWCDVRTGAYADGLLDRLGLGWAADLRPPVRADDDRAAPLTDAAAERLGLPAGTPVVLAPYDVVSTALGVGATRPGQACSILGTTLCTEIVVAEPELSAAPTGLHLFAGGPGRLLRAYPTLCGTEVADWAATLLGLGGAAELAELAAAAPPRADDPVLLPYLSPAGERAPFRDGAASGSLHGFDLTTGREAVARSVFAGLSAAIRECLEAVRVPVDELRVSGGGAASPYWCQLIADVTGVPVRRPADSQAGAKGALVAAAVALGRDPDLDAAAARLVRPGPLREPDPAAHEAATEAYDRALVVREAARESQWPRLRASTGKNEKRAYGRRSPVADAAGRPPPAT